MNYYNEIKNELLSNEINKKVKDYSKNKYELEKYYNVGRLLLEAGNKYGDGIIKEYSTRLTKELGKGYSQRNLYNMRLYYEKICCDKKLQPVAAILSWSHYSELLRLNDINEIFYYIKICIKNNYSKRELITRIKQKEYNRLICSTKNKIENDDKLLVQDYVKNPILIRSKYSNEEISEKILKKSILEDIDNFLLELGNNFSYITNEYKIKLDGRYNYIDLLLYNIEFNCYVVIELKVTELKKEHIGQIQVYMNYIDKNLKKINQDKTIGIIICKKNNKYVIEYCSDDRIIAREYELV